MSLPCNNPCPTCTPISGAANLGLSPLDPNNPFLNLSSEAPDVDLFIGRRPSVGKPPLGSHWYAVGCMGFCFSEVSQSDADLCAQLQAQLCAFGNWPLFVPNPNPGPGQPPFVPQDRPVYYNNQQSCAFTCPDGNQFIYTVVPGRFVALSQAEADAHAYSYACNLAVINRVCFGSLSATRSCSGVIFGSTVGVATSYLPVVFTLESGEIPTGMTLETFEESALISGVCNSPGDYTFTLRATDSQGNYQTKQFTITIFGIVDANELPDATINEAYTYTLSTGGTSSGSVAYAITSGALPAGLTLNTDTGEISGTPTVDGAYQFTVSATDGIGSCLKTFDLYSNEDAMCGIFSAIDWSGVTVFGTGVTGFPSGNTIDVTCVGPGLGMGATGLFGSGSMSYTGDGVNCNLTVLNIDGNLADACELAIWQDGIQIFAWKATVDGLGVFPFTLAAGVNSLITFTTQGAEGGVFLSAQDDNTQRLNCVIGT